MNPSRLRPSEPRTGKTLSQNGRFSTKKSGQFRGLTKDALLHSHVNRVTFSLTQYFANGKLRLPMSSHRGGKAGRSAGVVKLLPIIRYGVAGHRQIGRASCM